MAQLSGQQDALLALRNLDFWLDCVHTRFTRLCLLSPNPAHSAVLNECGSKRAFPRLFASPMGTVPLAD